MSLPSAGAGDRDGVSAEKSGVVRWVEEPAVPSTRVEGVGTAISCSWARSASVTIAAVALRKKVGALVAEPYELALRDVIPQRTGLEL
jgi:hypothetical protein